MPRVTLTFHDKARAKVQRVKAQCLGMKALKKLSWDDIADEMLVPRSTLVYRFNNDLFTLSEWIEFLHVLGIEKEDLDL